MIKRICDCCGEEVKKEFVKFYITWNMADAVSGESDNEKPRETYSLECCEKCFDGLLKNLGLEKDKKFKE